MNISFSAKTANSFLRKSDMRKHGVYHVFTTCLRCVYVVITTCVYALPSKSPAGKMDDC